MVGVLVGSDEYVLERAIGVVQNGGVDHLPRFQRQHAGQASVGPHRHGIAQAGHKLPRKASGHGDFIEYCGGASSGVQGAC